MLPQDRLSKILLLLKILLANYIPQQDFVSAVNQTYHFLRDR